MPPGPNTLQSTGWPPGVNTPQCAGCPPGVTQPGGSAERLLEVRWWTAGREGLRNGSVEPPRHERAAWGLARAGQHLQAGRADGEGWGHGGEGEGPGCRRGAGLPGAARPSPRGHQLPPHALRRKPAAPLKGADSWLGPLSPSSQAVSGPLWHQSLRAQFLRGPTERQSPGHRWANRARQSGRRRGQSRGCTDAPLVPGSQPPHLRNVPAVPRPTCVPRGPGHTALAAAAPPDSGSSLAPSFCCLSHGTSSKMPSLTTLHPYALPCVCVCVCVCVLCCC